MPSSPCSSELVGARCRRCRVVSRLVSYLCAAPDRSQREAGKAIDLDSRGRILGRRAHFLAGVDGFEESYGGGEVSPSEPYESELDSMFLWAAAAASPPTPFLVLGGESAM